MLLRHQLRHFPDKVSAQRKQALTCLFRLWSDNIRVLLCCKSSSALQAFKTAYSGIYGGTTTRPAYRHFSSCLRLASLHESPTTQRSNEKVLGTISASANGLTGQQKAHDNRYVGPLHIHLRNQTDLRQSSFIFKTAPRML